MPTDGQDDNPWMRPPQPYARPPERPVQTYPAPPAPPRARRRGSATLPAALGVAAVTGIGLGVALTRTGVLDRGPEPSLASAAATPSAPAVVMPVEVAAAAPPAPPAPPLAASERMEVLPAQPPRPPGLPSLFGLRRTPAPAPQAAPIRQASPQLAQAPSGTPASVIAAERAAPPPRLAPPEQAARAGGPCGWAETPAQQLVCEDRGLASADRRMRRAYQRALEAGAPEAELAADQDDWQRIREDAARHSRRAVANIYDQRIEELEDLAER